MTMVRAISSIVGARVRFFVWYSNDHRVHHSAWVSSRPGPVSVEDGSNNVRRGVCRVLRDDPDHMVPTKKFARRRQGLLDSIRQQNQDVARFYGNCDGRIFGLREPAQRGPGAFQSLFQVSGTVD